MLTALAARAKLRAWNDVDALFTTKVRAPGLSGATGALDVSSCTPCLVGISHSSYWVTFFLQLLIFQDVKLKEKLEERYNKHTSSLIPWI